MATLYLTLRRIAVDCQPSNRLSLPSTCQLITFPMPSGFSQNLITRRSA